MEKTHDFWLEKALLPLSSIIRFHKEGKPKKSLLQEFLKVVFKNREEIGIIFMTVPVAQLPWGIDHPDG